MNRQNIATFGPGASAHRKDAHAIFRKAGRDVAALALLQIFCFLTLAHLEPRFVFIHIYQLIPYVALLVLVVCGHRPWAYMIGALVSVLWLVLAYLAGALFSAVELLRTTESFSSSKTLVAFLAIVTAILAVLITLFCRIHWVKEYAGRGPSQRIFLASAGLVVAYYGILIRWFWDVVLRV